MKLTKFCFGAFALLASSSAMPVPVRSSQAAMWGSMHSRLPASTGAGQLGHPWKWPLASSVIALVRFMASQASCRSRPIAHGMTAGITLRRFMLFRYSFMPVPPSWSGAMTRTTLAVMTIPCPPRLATWSLTWSKAFGSVPLTTTCSSWNFFPVTAVSLCLTSPIRAPRGTTNQCCPLHMMWHWHMTAMLSREDRTKWFTLELPLRLKLERRAYTETYTCQNQLHARAVFGPGGKVGSDGC